MAARIDKSLVIFNALLRCLRTLGCLVTGRAWQRAGKNSCIKVLLVCKKQETKTESSNKRDTVPTDMRVDVEINGTKLALSDKTARHRYQVIYLGGDEFKRFRNLFESHSSNLF